MLSDIHLQALEHHQLVLELQLQQDPCLESLPPALGQQQLQHQLGLALMHLLQQIHLVQIIKPNLLEV